MDPHKWLLSPFDCAALIYRDPTPARLAHTQHAGYLDAIIDDAVYNPADHAHVLTRRARGVPFWFSLAVHGTDAYRDAIEHTLSVARATRDLVVAAEHLELLVEPELSVVAFRRRGWGADDYQAWCDRLMADGTAMLTPTTFGGSPAMRVCIINPRTTLDDLVEIFATLESCPPPRTNSVLAHSHPPISSIDPDANRPPPRRGPVARWETVSSGSSSAIHQWHQPRQVGRYSAGRLAVVLPRRVSLPNDVTEALVGERLSPPVGLLCVACYPVEERAQHLRGP